MASRPLMYVCYICGREYGSTSLEIHQKQCIKLWETQENLKPKNERRPLPKPPQELPMSSNNSKSQNDMIEARNKVAMDAYNTQTLVPCSFCGRTFLPEKLVVHNRSCREGSTSKRVGEPASNSTPSISSPCPLSPTSSIKPTTAPSPGKPKLHIKMNQDKEEIQQPSPSFSQQQQGKLDTSQANQGNTAKKIGKELESSSCSETIMAGSISNNLKTRRVSDCGNSSKEEQHQVLAERLIHLETNVLGILSEIQAIRSTLATLMTSSSPQP